MTIWKADCILGGLDPGSGYQLQPGRTAAAPKKGDIIIDVCAAPGGKSLHLADQLKRTGLVEARD